MEKTIRPINRLFSQLFINAAQQSNTNPILDSECIYNLLRIICPAAYKDTFKKINESGLYEMLRRIPRSSPNFFQNIGLTLIPAHEMRNIDYKYTEDVKNSFGSPFNILPIPNNKIDIDRINEWLKSQNDDTDFTEISNDGLDEVCRFTFWTKSTFTAEWEFGFSPSDTELVNFSTREGRTEVTMMKRHRGARLNAIFNVKFGILSCNTYKFPYNGGMSMIVIIPRMPRGKDELVNEIIADPAIFEVIEKQIYNKTETKFDYIEMPKFRIKRQYRLNEAFSKTRQLSALVEMPVDVRGVLINKRDPPPESVNSVTTIDIKNDETGTKVVSTAMSVYTDGPGSDKYLYLRTPFVYIICDDETKKISVMGIFTGPD